MKQKTRKAIAKKIKVSKGGKVIRVKSGQNHFNAKETGKAGRAKRRPLQLTKKDAKNVLKAVPYGK